ncbi:sulfatase [Sinomicrobium soli]|uniref:sulfatase n=1 Tax=Sinomicrobium sp. N-1-3-6 TaxID=2219864 RepID=UPI000DCD004E|nr:sulfatase [Sinomicrobium sp. N-1-3-6]RAV29544.1 iduronate-2-sulfatase [Sinomicrobium sp. N-1-3-6]
MKKMYKNNLLLFLILTLILSITCNAQKRAVKNKPNILFIAVDDLRPNLGCYGNSVAITPNIDRLAARGIVFDNAYCQQAVCAPSRASLMTGRRPDRTKVWNLNTHFRKALPDVVTLPQYFKQHGYHTECVGKIYHDPEQAQDLVSWSVPETLAVTGKAGPKYVLDINTNKKGSWKAAATENANVEDSAYVDGKVSRAAVNILNTIKDKPFFLAVGFRRPHLPFSAPQKYWSMYDRESLPLPANPDTPDGTPEVALHSSKELRGYTDIPESGPIPRQKIRELIHGYYASTSFIDAQIGKLLDRLEQLHLMENTIIVLWSDHGYHLGEHNLWSKTTNFELDTRVPLILSVPGQKQHGEHTDALVELVDLYPTLAELAGLPAPEGVEGISMGPLLSHPDKKWKKAVFSQFPRPWFYKDEPEIMGYSVRTRNYRYTEWLDFRTREVKARELYNHRNDPRETRNLANNNRFSEQVDRLSHVLKAGWQKATPH